MNASSDFARITSTLVLMASGWIVGVAAPAHCQEAPRFIPRVKAQLTAPSWFPTGNLNAGRYGHTATLLPNGKVLVVGGTDDNSPESAEIYDPSIGMWSVTGRPNHPRTNHSATLLPNGQVLVAGGLTGAGFTDTAELFDPGTGTWSFTGKMSFSRAFHTATLFRDGKVLVAAGNGPEFLTTCELYDPATGTWSPTGRLQSVQDSFGRAIFGRDLPQVTLLQDGRVLMAGGTFDVDLYYGMPNTELYDPVSGTWSHAPNLHVPRLYHSATLLRDGKVLVAGGDKPPYPFDPYQGPFFPVPPNNTAELFDPATGNWSRASTLNAARSGHTASLLPNGEVLVAGGYNNTTPWPGGIIKSAERYDASDALWRIASDLNTARYGHTATLLPNGRVLVAGGINAEGILNSAELYGPAPSPGTIGPGFTGAWYDPAQSGHGLFIEVLPDSRFYAAWFAFNPAGTQQAWFTGVGTYSGNTASIATVLQPTGGRWIPNFDPNQIVPNPWGTLTFTFTDCNHGTVDFNSVLEYGAGSMRLTRLTQPAGLNCP